MSSASSDLIDAARRGSSQIIAQLIAAGLAPQDGSAALIAAATHGHSNVVAQLLAAGAPLDLVDPRGNTALTAAVRGGHSNVVAQLLAAGALVDETNQYEETALIIAASIGNGVAIELLLRYNADIDAKECNGSTSLMRAANGDYPCATLQLLNAGADRYLQNDDGQNADDLSDDRYGINTLLRLAEKAETQGKRLVDYIYGMTPEELEFYDEILTAERLNTLCTLVREEQEAAVQAMQQVESIFHEMGLDAATTPAPDLVEIAAPAHQSDVPIVGVTDTGAAPIDN